MSRLTGPRLKIIRALGTPLPGLTRKQAEGKPRPGQHGTRRRKISPFGRRLAEAQKLRFNYGLSERQLRNLFREASRSRANPGVKALELLERRLDNVIFRAGYAPTIPAARQLITHGHVLVNGKRVDRPAYRVRIGCKVSPSQKGLAREDVRRSLMAPALLRPSWLHFDESTAVTEVIGLPDPTSVPFPVEVALVIEHYAGKA